MRGGDIRRTAAVLMLLACAPAWAGPSEPGLLVQGVRAFRTGANDWDYAAFTNAEGLLQSACRVEPESYAAHYWLGVARFHMLLHRLGREDAKRDRDEEASLMGRALASLEQALALDPDHAETHALLSTLRGMRIANAPHTALWRGRKVSWHKKQALRLGPDNPRIHYLLGMSHFHAPAILGGKKAALASLRKAERLFEAERARAASPLDPAWGYVHCLAFIAEAYFGLGKIEEADVYYRKACAVNPEHRMAKEGLQKCLKRTTRR